MGDPETVSADIAGRVGARSRRGASKRTVVHRAVSVLLGVGLAVGVAGCAGSAPVVSPYDPASIFDEALQQARDYGASEHQIAVLEAAKSKGELTYEEFMGLLEESFACLEANGQDYVVFAPTENIPGSGFLIPHYGIISGPGGPDSAPDAMMDECLFTNSEFASMVYQVQPIAVEAQLAAFERIRGQVLACLRENGVEIDDEATYNEVSGASLDLFLQMESVRSGSGVECVP